jgi:HEAT repeat protein
MSKKGCLIGCDHPRGRWLPDTAARETAARTLMGALQEMQGEPRIQLVMRFCGRDGVPKEAIPFLVEALHAEEMPSGSYPAMALSRVEGEAAVPALIDVITNDDDEHAQAGAVSALDMMLMERSSEAAEAALKHAATTGSEAVQKQAREALKRHEEWENRGKPKDTSRAD